MNTFTVNGKTYQAAELNMLFLTFLNKHHIDNDLIDGIAATACYLAFCSGMSEVQANNEISEHVIKNEGEFPTELIESYRQAIEDSGFFRALAKRGEKAEQTNSEAETSNTEAAEQKSKKK
jgi:hypothetical protein